MTLHIHRRASDMIAPQAPLYESCEALRQSVIHQPMPTAGWEFQKHIYEFSLNPTILLNFFSPQKTLNSTGFLGTAHAHVNNLLHDVILQLANDFFLHRTVG